VLPVPIQTFLIETLSETVALILDAGETGTINPRDAAIFAIKKGLLVAGLGAELSESKLLECGVAVASLALTTIDTVELENACAAVGATGFASPAAAVVAVTGALYYGYQVFDTLQTCGSAFSAPARDDVELQFPAAVNISSQRANYTDYANNVCIAGSPDPVVNM